MTLLRFRRNLLVNARRSGLQLLAAALLIGGSTVLMGPADNANAAAEDSCSTGVVVVVDSTEIGGNIGVSCAEGTPETGRSSLKDAGFTVTDSEPGLICAINSKPDPCPTTFQGSFWSYWHATADGAWTSYQVGADSSHPKSGQIEGWRYGDGSTPPDIEPAAALKELTPEVATAAPAATAPESAPKAASELSIRPIIIIGVSAVLVALLVTVLVVRTRRTRARGRD